MSEDIGQAPNESKRPESRGNRAEDYSKTVLKIVHRVSQKEASVEAGTAGREEVLELHEQSGVAEEAEDHCRQRYLYAEGKGKPWYRPFLKGL